MMANEHWYRLKVRRGFELLIAQRLQKLNLEIFVPECQSVTPQESALHDNESAVYIYSRFDLSIRNSVLAVPGVLDTTGTPESAPCDKEVSAIRRKAFRVL
jgi:Transcription termination factor nusG